MSDAAPAADAATPEGGGTLGTDGVQTAELPPAGDGSFADLMDALVKDEGEQEGAEGAGKDGAGAPAGGEPAGGKAAPAADAAGDAGGKPGDGAPAAAADAGKPGAAGEADGGQGDAAGDPAGGTAVSGGGDLPADWTADGAELAPRFARLSTAFEERASGSYQQAALAEVREEHKNYFDALNQHPRQLVGQQVPAIGKEGTETLRDTNDAREWQDAVKQILVEEVKSRAEKAMEDSGDFMTNVHASIELFQNNPDLIPGAKNFDIELANRLTTMLEPYELRVDGKLQGYSIAVQPLLDQIRSGLTAERTAKSAAAPASPSPEAGAAGGNQGGKQADPPQAGIQSKAGAGSEKEDFSTLFGTIGLSELQI